MKKEYTKPVSVKNEFKEYDIYTVSHSGGNIPNTDGEDD